MTMLIKKILRQLSMAGIITVSALMPMNIFAQEQGGNGDNIYDIGENYNPDSPGDPSGDIYRKVTFNVDPASGGYFLRSNSTIELKEGDEFMQIIYPFSDWSLSYWTINGKRQSTGERELNFTMGNEPLDIVAHMIYNPGNPGNPSSNFYDAQSGLMILDDFTPGYLYDAFERCFNRYGFKFSNYDEMPYVSTLIVKGVMERSDYYISNLPIGDTLDFSRTGGVNVIPTWGFEYSKVSTICLPYDISELQEYVFYECENLTSLIVNSPEPPKCTEYTFHGFPNKENLTVYVPLSALSLYEDAEYWKDFTILPLSGNTHTLEVNLPEEASDGRYKNFSLELFNRKSNVKQRYVVSDRMSYTFNGLQEDERFDVYLMSQAGIEIGRISDIVIPAEDITVSFDKLITLNTVNATVKDKEGNDVTSDVSIEWLMPDKEGNLQYLKKSKLIKEMPEGQELICRINLNDKLGGTYHCPEDLLYVVKEGDNDFVIILVPFKTVTLSGIVKDTDGKEISDASVTATQILNGKYSKNFSSKTDRKGAWTMEVLDAPESKITYSAIDFINLEDFISSDEKDGSFDLGEVRLRRIKGISLQYDFTFKGADEKEAQDNYSDHLNVVISGYNISKDKEIKEISIQYPILVLQDENIISGDKIKLIASSKTNAFKPVESTVEINDNLSGTVTFNIIGKGGIESSFGNSQNPVTVGILYNSKGELLKTEVYSQNKVTFSNLDDGKYFLITMGRSDLMNSILKMSSFDEMNLTEKKDYVLNEIEVVSGIITKISNEEIPIFDDTLLYYTSNNSGFSVNKTNLTAGNYLTLKSNIDFKENFKKNISNVSLIIDLPEDCALIDQSIIQGAEILPYTYDDNRVSISLNNYLSQIRFCIMPTIGGDYTATSYVEFELDGKKIIQPFGSVKFLVKDLSIYAPAVTSGTSVMLLGVAPARSEVMIYDNDLLTATTQTDLKGEWSQEISINDSEYNYSYHYIHAKIKTTDDKVLTTETKKISYQEKGVSVKNVEMIFGPYNFTLDFEKPSNSGLTYTYPTCGQDFTFLVNLSDNDPDAVSNVRVNVLCMDQTIETLDAFYDENKKRWVAYGEFPYSYHLPINCNVEFDAPLLTFDDSNRREKEYEAIGDAIEEMEAYADEYIEAEILVDEEDRSVLLLTSPNTNRNWILESRFLENYNYNLDDFFYIESDNYYKSENLIGDSYSCIIVDNGEVFEFKLYPQDSESSAKRLGNYGNSLPYKIFDKVTDNLIPFKSYLKGCYDYNFWVNDHLPELLETIYEQQQKVFDILYAQCPDGTPRLTEAQKNQFLEEFRNLGSDVSMFEGVAYSMAELWGSKLKNAFAFESLTMGLGKALKMIPNIRFYASNGKGGGCMRYLVKGGKKNRELAEELIEKAYENELKKMEMLGELTGWTDFMDFESISETFQNYVQEGYSRYLNEYSSLFRRIINAYKKCTKNPTQTPNDKQQFPNKGFTPYIDPSGYVYEAVPVNRVEGVQASIYYKETKEDMYGDPYEEEILWDAEEYAQENPLFTDENGMYAWDVPQGLWQARFEKDGYVSTQSEWLPVPPPQLEVNIPITQNKQPEVISARAYETGIEVQFDKFMDLSTLNTSNIYVTANEDKLHGSIEFIDSELADEFANEEDESALRYASRVRFVPENKLSASSGEIRLTVSRNVLSYAGISLAQTYSQVLDVEKEVEEILADDIKVLYGSDKELTIYAIPFDAAAGRTLHISNSSSLIISMDVDEVVFDKDGKAVIMVYGDLPGRAELTFTMDDVYVTGECAVSVVTEILTPEAPKASRANGSAVYRGAEITLSTDTEGGIIYYTLDGSCPCEDNGSRMIYENPIVVNDDIRILAVTYIDDSEEGMSDIVEFSYRLKRSDIEFNLNKGWNWISHNFDSGIPVNEIMDESNSISTIMSQTAEAVRNANNNLEGSLSELNSNEAYKVNTDKNSVIKKIDVARDPSLPISLTSGCNWISYPIEQIMAIDEALAATEVENEEMIVGRDGFSEFNGEKWIGTLSLMTPGEGYLYYSKSDKDLTYNTSIVSKANAGNRKQQSLGADWMADNSKYPSVMPIIADILRPDGSVAEDGEYEVAAFCGSECRGVGRNIEGYVFMSVYGNPGDEISFRILPAGMEDVLMISETITLNENPLGNLSSPYPISTGDTGMKFVKDDSGVRISVKDNMLYVFGNEIRSINIYDIEGNKVLMKVDVSDTGIPLFGLVPGVYVISVDNEGKWSYSKVIIN